MIYFSFILIGCLGITRERGRELSWDNDENEIMDDDRDIFSNVGSAETGSAKVSTCGGCAPKPLMEYGKAILGQDGSEICEMSAEDLELAKQREVILQENKDLSNRVRAGVMGVVLFWMLMYYVFEL